MTKNKKYLFTLLILSTLLMTTWITISMPVAKAQPNADLVNQYAPLLKFTGAEKFYPTSVDYVITSSTVKERSSYGSSSTVAESNPTASNLGQFTGTNLFLDNKLGTVDAIADDYSSKAASLGYYAYVHVTSSGGYTVIQYWLLYAFNDGPLNAHQGDWEVIEIFLSGSNPVKALYSQHGAGENAVWADVEKDGTHPVVYVAQGSHANYFRSYQGKIGLESDIVGNDGKTIRPTDLQVVTLGDNLNNLAPDQSWLNFKGRWGYWGSDQQVALGQAGPLGPVSNQDGTRWAQPTSYLDSTLSVNGTYFTIALLVANFLLIFIVYTLARAGWKVFGIARLQRKGGLLVRKIMKGQVLVGLLIGVAGIAVAIAGFFLPWYSITASSETGPLSQQPGGTTLMTINGVSGLQVNLFMGTSSADSTSGFVSLASAQMPFAIILAAGVILLILDIIGLKNKNKLGNKLITGIVGMLLPIVFVLAIVMALPSILPMASGLIPGQSIPVEVQNLVSTIGASPAGGTASTTFQVVGQTTVKWGLGIGSYLFIVAAILRIVGGLIIRIAPNPKIQQTQQAAPASNQFPPPPPPPT